MRRGDAAVIFNRRALLPAWAFRRRTGVHPIESMAPHSGQNDDPASKATAEREAADSLPSAIILGFVGGLLDAFLYLEHGHVFAGAMTGNAVLCGIALMGGKGPDIWHHALPILAFLCGVWTAEVLQARVKHHSVTLALGAEATGLLIASFLPASFPDQLYVFFIALVAAFQIASFRKADKYSYNSTFITGDLRTFAVGLYEAMKPEKRAEGLRQARAIGTVIVAFLDRSSRWVPGSRRRWAITRSGCRLPRLMGVFAMALRRSLKHEAEVRQQQPA